MERRDFLKNSAFTAGTIAFSGINLYGNEIADKPGQLPKRQYGKHNVHLSIIGFGGIVVVG